MATYRAEHSERPLSPEDLDDVRLLMKPELRRRRQQLAWEVDLPGGVSTIKGGPVRHAVLNLLLNASAATPDGGQIVFRASRQGCELRLEVSDQGGGIPDDVASILTAADPGPAVRAGHGLGLWMVRRVIDELKGTVWVRGATQGGTVVTLILPNSREADLNAA